MAKPKIDTKKNKVPSKKGLPELPKLEPKELNKLPDYPIQAEEQLQKGFISKLKESIKRKKMKSVEITKPKEAPKITPDYLLPEKKKEDTPMVARPSFKLSRRDNESIQSFKEIDKINKDLDKINKEISKIKV